MTDPLSSIDRMLLKVIAFELLEGRVEAVTISVRNGGLYIADVRHAAAPISEVGKGAPSHG